MMALTPLCALLLAGLTSSLLVTCWTSGFARTRRSELLLAALVAPLASLPFVWLTAPACLDPAAVWTACAASLHSSPQTSGAIQIIHPPASVGAIVLFGVLLVVSGAVMHVALRSATLGRRIELMSLPADGRLQTRIAQVSHHFALRAPRLLILTASEPVAFTYGIWRPTIVLSTWMVEELDADELDAVLAHELSHVARRDYLLMLLATTLRNAFFYLPPSQIAHQQLCREKERACDDLAIARCAQPLALASALTKVWQSAASARAMPSIVQALAGQGDMIEDRLIRLLAADDAAQSLPVSPNSPLAPHHVARFSPSALSAVILANSALFALVLGAMGCLRGI